MLWLDIADHFITHYGLVMVGIAECCLVGWFFKITNLRRHINKISSIRIGLWWDLVIKYFAPFVLGVILIGDLYQEIQKPYGGYSWASIILIGGDWVLITLIVAFVFSAMPWKTEKNKQNGRID